MFSVKFVAGALGREGGRTSPRGPSPPRNSRASPLDERHVDRAGAISVKFVVAGVLGRDMDHGGCVQREVRGGSAGERQEVAVFSVKFVAGVLGRDREWLCSA